MIEVVMIETVMIKPVMVEMMVIETVMMPVEIVKVVKPEEPVRRVGICVGAGVLIVARLCRAAGQENEAAEQEGHRRGRRQAMNLATSVAAGRLSERVHDMLPLRKAD
jgi:hypothetical protein